MTEPGSQPLVLQNLPLATPPLFMELALRQYRERVQRAFNGNPAAFREYLALPIEERAKYSLLHGLMHFGVDEGLPAPARYATVLREPIEAVAAFYYLVLASPSHYLYPFVTQGNWTLDDLISNRRVEIDNPQVRMLNPIASVPFGQVTEAMLADAKRRLDERYEFGLAERLPETLALLQSRLGWGEVRCAGRPLQAAPATAHTIAPSTLERLRSLNRFDLSLYAHAAAAFDRRIAQEGPGFAARVSAILADNARESSDTVFIGGEAVSTAPLSAEDAAARDTAWVASYPRSGNTWLRFLLDSYVFPAARMIQDVGRLTGELDWWVQEARRLGHGDSWIVHAGRHIRRRHPLPEGFPGDLYFKTHYALSPTHPLRSRSVRAVYLLRNPRDVLLSGMNFAELTSGVRLESERQYALDFINRGGDPAWIDMGYGTWAEHARSWNEDAGFPVMLVRYEDLKADTPGVFERVIRFLGMPFDHSRLLRAIELSSLSRLQNLETASRATGELTGLRSADRKFFHKGLSGQGLAHLGEDVEGMFHDRFAADARRWGYDC